MLPPAADDELVYLGMTQRGEHAQYTAVNLSSGARAWCFPEPCGVGSLRGTAHRVAVGDGAIYVASGTSPLASSTLHAVDTKGHELWRKATCEYNPLNVSNPGDRCDGIIMAPVVDGGVVYTTTGSHSVVAVDAKTGAALWSWPGGIPPPAPPAPGPAATYDCELGVCKASSKGVALPLCQQYCIPPATPFPPTPPPPPPPPQPLPLKCKVQKIDRYQCGFAQNQTRCEAEGCCWQAVPNRCNVMAVNRFMCSGVQGPSSQKECEENGCCWDKTAVVPCYEAKEPECYRPSAEKVPHFESQLAVGGGAVYFFVRRQENTDVQLISLDAKTGAERWSRPWPLQSNSFHSPQYQGVAVAPGGDTVVALIPSIVEGDDGRWQDMVALAAADGTKLWTLSLPRINLKDVFISNQFRYSTPVVRDGIVVTAGAYVVAVDLVNGTELWQYPGAGPNATALCLAQSQRRDCTYKLRDTCALGDCCWDATSTPKCFYREQRATPWYSSAAIANGTDSLGGARVYVTHFPISSSSDSSGVSPLDTSVSELLLENGRLLKSSPGPSLNDLGTTASIAMPAVSAAGPWLLATFSGLKNGTSGAYEAVLRAFPRS